MRLCKYEKNEKGKTFSRDAEGESGILGWDQMRRVVKGACIGAETDFLGDVRIGESCLLGCRRCDAMPWSKSEDLKGPSV